MNADAPADATVVVRTALLVEMSAVVSRVRDPEPAMAGPVRTAQFQ